MKQFRREELASDVIEYLKEKDVDVNDISKILSNAYYKSRKLIKKDVIKESEEQENESEEEAIQTEE